jgi:hypothetical protein
VSGNTASENSTRNKRQENLFFTRIRPDSARSTNYGAERTDAGVLSGDDAPFRGA